MSSSTTMFVLGSLLSVLPSGAVPSCPTVSSGQSLLQVGQHHVDSALHQNEDTPSCAPFNEWPDIDDKVTCGSCTALVLALPYNGKCDTYCESFGHVCLAAAEEKRENCEVKYVVDCSEEIGGTSDILCTCGLPPQDPVAPEPQPMPEPEAEPEPEPEPVESDCCMPFDAWPNVDGVTCGTCTALVLTAPYGGRCDQYCSSFGHVCVEAAEEEDENCVAKYTVGCDEEITSTSDMLCRCRLSEKKGSCQEPTLSSTEAPPASTQAPTPSPQVQPAAATPSPSEPHASSECCLPFGQWPDVDKGVTCGTCTALVRTAPYEGVCAKYCQSYGHVCVAAAEEEDNNCAEKYTVGCEVAITGTSDMLCTCSLPAAAASCHTTSTTVPSTTAPSGNSQRIMVSGRQLLVEGRPLHLKGVAWNPVKKGSSHPWGLDMPGTVDQDADLMARAGINVVRTYASITDIAVLDAFWARGIWVVNSVYNYGKTDLGEVAKVVNAVKNHPAILMWTIGNEWNYNGLYVDMSFDQCVARVDAVAKIVKQHDTAHPVATIYGGLHRLNEAMGALADSIDIVGLNVYRGIGFGDLFDAYAGITSKPMFLGEYGADAWNSLIGREDPDAQAEATAALTRSIVDRTAVRAGGTCLGGFIFEFSDEWWKDGNGSPWVQDTGGIAPGGGPHPDSTFNEEWWGLVTIDRVPRRAYQSYAEIAIPTP